MSFNTSELRARYQSAMIHAILTTVNVPVDMAMKDAPVDMTIDDAPVDMTVNGAPVDATMDDVPVGTMIVEIKMIKMKLNERTEITI